MKTLALPFLACAVALSSGCVTRGYKLTDKDVPPAVALNLTNAPVAPTTPPGTCPIPETVESAPASPAAPPSPAVTLQTVIVYQGPGSWKREAYWDEYVVAITNRGETPLVVTAAALHDGKSELLTPGDKPWALENLSKRMLVDSATHLGKTGTYVVAGVGAAAMTAAVASGVASLASTAAFIGASTVAVAALPVVLVGAVVIDQKAKHVIEAEFNHRRIILPLTLAPGQTAQGSFFFRITPSPQQLALHCAVGDQSYDSAVDLAPLAGLHLIKPSSGDSVAPTTTNPAPSAPCDRLKGSRRYPLACRQTL